MLVNVVIGKATKQALDSFDLGVLYVLLFSSNGDFDILVSHVEELVITHVVHVSAVASNVLEVL